MTRYRTRPREVEATQWNVLGDHPGVERWPVASSYCASCQTNTGLHGYFGDDEDGRSLVCPTDWIVTDATGHRIVRAADFAEQFEEIGDE